MKTDIKSFADLPLSDDVLDALEDIGFEKPTDIQKEAIPPILEGRDVIGQAQTGTGKTGAFGIPLVQRLDPDLGHVQALFLVPTRELAEQVSEEINDYGTYAGVEAHAVYGGAGFGPQIRAFEEGVPVIVGTPGRVMDHMRRGNLKLDHVKFFGLDEADRMLDMGFIDDIRWTMKRLPRKVQILLFSATMPVEIMNLAKEFMNNPLTLMVSEDELTVEGTEQIYYSVGYRNKVWALYRVLEAEDPELAFVFCRTKYEVDKVGRLLKSHGYKAEVLHGDLGQGARNQVMDNVREGKTNIVVATDVLARGIDVSHCSHVINYDIPEDPEWYVHRIGRTGRMGKLGKAITFVTKEETRAVQEIEDVAGGRLKLKEVPETRGKDRIRRVMDWKEIAGPTGFARFRIQIGRKDDVKMMEVFRAINKACGFRDDTLGTVSVQEEHTDVEVPFQAASRFWEKYRNGEVLGHKVQAVVLDERHQPMDYGR